MQKMDLIGGRPNRGKNMLYLRSVKTRDQLYFFPEFLHNRYLFKYFYLAPLYFIFSRGTSNNTGHGTDPNLLSFFFRFVLA